MKAKHWQIGVMIIFLSPALFAFSVNGIGGTLLPHPRGQIRNPAYVLYPEFLGYGSGTGVPFGLLGLARDPSNPLNYITNPEIFQNSFDLLSFYDQFSHPMEYLLNPPRSSAEVRIALTDSGITVTDGLGNPLRLGSYNGSRNIAVGGTPLIPPQVLRFPWKAGPLYFSSGLFIGGGGHSVRFNNDLERLLNVSGLSPDQAYTVTSSADFMGGISQHITYPFKVSIQELGIHLYFGLRAVLYYTLLYGEYSFTASARSDERGFPSTGSVDTSYYYLYPGKGAGGGGRIDAGFVSQWRKLTLGFGILNLAGISLLSGYTNSVASLADLSNTAEQQTRVYYSFLPAITANGAYRIPLGQNHFLIAADIGYLQNLSFHAGFGLFTRYSFFKWGAGWENGFRWSSGLGIGIKKVWIEVIITSHQAPFIQEQVIGMAVNVGIVHGP